MWRYYLGQTQPSPDSVPARCRQFSGMPATFISCPEVDPLRDEAFDYPLRRPLGPPRR
ncbi:hypothetical protein H7H69_02720 [Mycobacterium heckeshornense]|nr:hypothetical protein [Mycobacterium heckeshornense]MCV7033161.1 hypothetical protein [Mycobacterium heckeshornense]